MPLPHCPLRGCRPLSNGVEPPTEADFVFGEVWLDNIDETFSPSITKQQSMEAAVTDVVGTLLGDEQSEAFLSKNVTYAAELKSFSFNADLGVFPDIQGKAVWALRIEGVPIEIPCGPPPPEGFRLECPRTTDIIAIIDAESGAHIHGNLQTREGRWLIAAE